MAPEFDRTLTRGNLTLSYSLYDGGGRGARIERAESGEAMAEAGEVATRMDIIGRTATAFLDLLTTGDLLEASEAQLDALIAEEERVQDFLAQGKAARVDLLRVQAARSRAEATAISLRSQLDMAQGRLARVTGLAREELVGRRLVQVSFSGNPFEARNLALEKAADASPELALARYQLSGASASVREARANWYPQLQAAGSYSEFGALNGSHSFEWQGSIQLSYPLFTGGARRGELDRAVAEERKAAEALRRTELVVEEGVEEALAAVVEARAVRSALEVGVVQAEEVARIEALALEVGSGVQTDFLAAQAALFQSRAALLQARHGEVLAGIHLVRVTGELDLEWLRDNMEVFR
jgi:outer membrane protein